MIERVGVEVSQRTEWGPGGSVLSRKNGGCQNSNVLPESIQHIARSVFVILFLHLMHSFLSLFSVMSCSVCIVVDGAGAEFYINCLVRFGYCQATEEGLRSKISIKDFHLFPLYLFSFDPLCLSVCLSASLIYIPLKGT